MTALLALLGAGVGVGVLLVVDSFRAAPSEGASISLMNRLPPDAATRMVRAVTGGVILGLVTRWPIAFAGGAALGWWTPDIIGGGAARRDGIARTEAIASWTEMLRDTITSAHGLQETITTSSHVAPDPIRPEVVRLATSLESQPLKVCLRTFATDLAHPTGDLVVAALMLAAEGSARDLGELLGTLAVAARDEAGMSLRVDAARARMRTAVRVITLSTVATAIMLAFINRSYLRSYDNAEGQVVLGLIAVVWGASLVWLSRMSNFDQPERFFAADKAQT